MRTLGILIIAVAVFVAACADPAANKPKATTSDVTNTTPANTQANTASAEQPKGELVELNSENTKLEFTGSKVTGKHDGGFKTVKGNIDLVDGKAEGSTVRVEIDMASVYTDADGLTEHLKNEDFFLVSQHPTSTFNLTKIEADPAKAPDGYTVSGELELRGVKKQISFPATIKTSDAEVSVDSEFSINRRDFGVNYDGKANDLIRDDVVIRLSIKAPRKK